MTRTNTSLLIAALATTSACRSDLVAGTWSCNPRDAGTPEVTAAVDLPWSTGFESEFCDYALAGGFCYAAPFAAYETVTSPVHSGKYAAAFRVRSDQRDAYQARCVRQGVMPTEAYYGAWYFVPERSRNAALWNLLHFQGGDPAQQHGLWDVSLINSNDGDLQVIIFDFLRSMERRTTITKVVPTGAWFHLELYLRRASDTTGEVALYQDGQKLWEAKNIVTDDTSWGQWYVGNLATGLTPPESVVYVDDVTIRTSR